MSYPIHIKEPSIGYRGHSKELDTPIQTYVASAKNKIKPQEINLLPSEDKLKAAKGFINALILCIPFWVLVIMLFAWFI
jgi:hypothetical protein